MAAKRKEQLPDPDTAKVSRGARPKNRGRTPSSPAPALTLETMFGKSGAVEVMGPSSPKPVPMECGDRIAEAAAQAAPVQVIESDSGEIVEVKPLQVKPSEPKEDKPSEELVVTQPKAAADQVSSVENVGGKSQENQVVGQASQDAERTQKEVQKEGCSNTLPAEVAVEKKDVKDEEMPSALGSASTTQTEVLPEEVSGATADVGQPLRGVQAGVCHRDRL